MRHGRTTAYENASLPPILPFPLMGGKGHFPRTPPPSEGEE